MKFFDRSSPKAKIVATKLNQKNSLYKSQFANRMRTLESKGQVTGNDYSIWTIASKNKNEFIPKPDTALKLYKDIYNKVPIAKISVDNTANFGVQCGYQLEGDDSDVETIKNWIRANRFDPLKVRILKEVQVFGNVFLEWSSLKILPVWDMRLIVSKAKENNGQLLGYIQLTNGTDSIRFDPSEIVHFKWNVMGNSFYGTSEYKAILSNLTYLLNFQNDVGEIMHRYANPIIHHKLGTDEKPASDDDISDYKALLDGREVGEDLVTSSAVNVNPIVANLRMVQPDGMLKHIENQIIAGLGVPEIFIRGGETSNKATAQVELQAFDRKVKSLRQAQSITIEDEIFKRIVKGDVRYSWNELSIEGTATKAETFQRLVAPGMGAMGLPIQTALRMVGWGSWINDYEADREDQMAQIQKIPAKKPPSDREPERDREKE